VGDQLGHDIAFLGITGRCLGHLSSLWIGKSGLIFIRPLSGSRLLPMKFVTCDGAQRVWFSFHCMKALPIVLIGRNAWSRHR
jgi:hypothetical protein